MDLVAAEHWFEIGASWLALGAEVGAVLIVTYGAIQAFIGVFRPVGAANDFFLGRKATLMKLAFWIMLALQFALAADLIRTAITPTWDEIGQLAAIAVIRTFLNYFLQRDVREFAGEAFGPESAQNHTN